MTKPFCSAPFIEGFSGLTSAFRNCCVVDPQIQSLPGQSFVQWWSDTRLKEFRQSMYTTEWPAECYRCQLEEKETGRSFRTALNSSIVDDSFGKWPTRWNLKFGNICNLACWTCNEHSSSVVAQNKRVIGILPENFVDPEEQFQTQWPALKADILTSYEYHTVVTLTLLGGEPLYNSTVIDFLQELKTSGLASRTRLEFHTNATKVNKILFEKGIWNYVCIFVSLDAVGVKAEWLRYGCKWPVIESNIEFLQSVADYFEIQCVLSVLNLNDLPTLKKFCLDRNVTLNVTLVTTPECMSIEKWSGDPTIIADREYLSANGCSGYYDLLGSKLSVGTEKELQLYIKKFDSIRRKLQDFDPKLAQALGLD
jgi:organic radical activating enzyme